MYFLIFLYLCLSQSIYLYYRQRVWRERERERERERDIPEMMLIDYMSRKEGGGDLTSIEDSVDPSHNGSKTTKKSGGGRLIIATRNNIGSTTINRTVIIRRNRKKEVYGRFKRLISDIMINLIKARIDKTQQNTRLRLCGDRDEKINPIRECSNLANNNYETKNKCVGKVFHSELCK